MKALLLYLGGLTGFVFLVGLVVFAGEVNDRVATDMGDALGNTGTAQVAPANAQFVGFRLGDERFDPGAVVIDNLQTVPKGSGQLTIQLRMANKGSAGFPHLRVLLLNQDNQLLRTIEFSPNQYVHERVFTTQNISLDIAPRAGEVRFLVEPFFEEQSK